MKKVCSFTCARKGCQMDKTYKKWGRNWNNEKRLTLLRSAYSFHREHTVQKVIKRKDAFSIFESRFDTIVYKLGWSHSINGARQLITHQHLSINNKVVSWPGYIVQPNDEINIVHHSTKKRIAKTLKERLSFINQLNEDARLPWLLPSYLYLNYNILSAILLFKPTLQDIKYPCQDVEQMSLAIDKYKFQ